MHLAQVNRQLVKQDQSRLAAEKFSQGPCPGSDTAFVALTHSRIPILSGKRIRDLPPGGVREKAFFHRPAIGRIRVFTIECGDTDSALRKKGRIDKIRNTRHTLHATGGMAQRDQTMGLAAPVRGIEPENRRNFTPRTAQPPAHVDQQVLESPCGIGDSEETGRIEIFGIAFTNNDLGQIRSKIGLGNRSFENILAWPACLEYGGNRHGLCSAGSPVASGVTAFAEVHWSISLFLNRQEPPTLKPGIALWETNR